MNIKTLVSAALVAGFAYSASACMTFVAGKKVSATGHVIVGHNEDDWPPLVVRHGMLPARDWPTGTCLPATPGCCATVPQARHTLACYWGEVKFPYGDGNADTFLNERGVIVVSDSGGSSTERMDDPALLTEGGVKFNLRRAVGERATSAREGVSIIAELVEKYGYAPSARIYTVADADEAWLVQVVHGRNFVAVRCPDDAVTVMPNLYTVYELDAFPAEDVVASKDLVENAKRKGFWDGKGKFNFAKAYQGTYDYGPDHAFEHPNNTGRFRQAIRLLTGEDWPVGRPFPFSVKPKGKTFSVADMKAILSAHNPPSRVGAHVLESWSICSSTTIESSVCEFTESPRDVVLHLAAGRGCEKPYMRLRPFAEPLPKSIDDSATAERRLSEHVKPDAPKISVFASFIRRIAKERGISKSAAADLLYDLGVRGFDVGPNEADLDELAATRLKPINFYYFPDWFGRNDRSKTFSPEECLRRATQLGVPRIMVVPPSFTGGRENEEEFARILEHMREFVAEAKKRAITVTVEDFGGPANCCSYSKYLKRLLDEVPGLRFALDSGNLYYAGRGEDILEMMEFAKGRIGHVHLKDQTRENNRKFATLGLGVVPNEKIVKSVAADYDGWYTLENTVGDVYNDTVRQVALLKAWLAEAAKGR